MKRLYFIRHGLSEGNIQGVWSGSFDTPLSPEGRRQAKAAGKKARKFKIDYMISSPLSRAMETAHIVAKEIGYSEDKIHINDLFVERNFGELEGQPWQPDLDMDGIADIETRDTILERARLAIEFLKTVPAHHILIVSHGSFGRALRHHLTEHKFEDQPTPESRIKNAEVIRWI